MNRSLAFLLAQVAFALSAFAGEYSERIVHVVEQLRTSKSSMLQVAVENQEEKREPMPFVGGCSVGFGGDPGEFFLLIPYFETFATESDVRSMLVDRSPVVRVMAARILLKGKAEWQKKMSFDKLLVDQARLDVVRGGCEVERMTVAELVDQMRSDPDFFGEYFYYYHTLENTKADMRANKTVDPTPGDAPRNSGGAPEG